MTAMTWAQIAISAVGVAIAGIGVAAAIWFNILNRQDKNFDKVVKLIETYEERNDKAHGDLGNRIAETNRKMDSGFEKVNETLRTVDGNVRELVGCFKERDGQ